jgi:predicted ATPase
VLCRPFVEPEEELAYLAERRRDAGSSHGSLVLIAGDAGVGKSRLISEFSASLAIGRKTVEKHLGSVYQKLGILSRVQLPRDAAESAG